MDIKAILGDSSTNELVKAINEAIGKEFVAKDKYNAKNEALKASEVTVKERDTQIEKLIPLSAGNESLNGEIKKLQEANKLQKEGYEKNLRESKEKLLRDKEIEKYNPISRKAIEAELDYTKVSYDDDKTNGLVEQLEAIKNDDNLKFLLKQEKEPIPTGTGTKQNPTADYGVTDDGNMEIAMKAAGLKI